MTTRQKGFDYLSLPPELRNQVMEYCWNSVNDLIWFYGRRVIFMLHAKHIGLRLISNTPLSAKELNMLAQMAQLA